MYRVHYLVRYGIGSSPRVKRGYRPVRCGPLEDPMLNTMFLSVCDHSCTHALDTHPELHIPCLLITEYFSVDIARV